MNLKIKNMIQLHAAYKSLPLDLKTWIDWKWKEWKTIIYKTVNRRSHLTQRSALLISSFSKEWDITFLEFLLWFFLPISALLFMQGSILSTSLRHCSQAWPLLWWSETSMLYGFWNCISSLFMEPHRV